MSSKQYDYIIVRGGTVGCVLAARPSQAGEQVALFEAGPENYSDQIMSPIGAASLHGSPAEYNYQSTPQPSLNKRQVHTHGGKLLSGSSGVNYGLWTRGKSTDYDVLAETVHDERWNYAHMVQYLKRSETHHDPHGDRESDGFNGPISTICGGRNYLFRQPVLDALLESGLELNYAANSGNPIGPAARAYDLSRAHVFPETSVARIDIDPGIMEARGVTTVDGRSFIARKEVIISCGAIKSPQPLMLSGIVPAEHLNPLKIRPLVDLPVGENYHDHLSGSLFFKLREPEKGLAIISPKFTRPDISDEDLAIVKAKDGLTSYDPILRVPRAQVDLMGAYVPIASSRSGYNLPFDGTHIGTPICMLLPTGRGSVRLASTDPTADPIIDPNYLATEADRMAMRTGFRTALRVIETDAGRKIVHGEIPPPRQAQLTSESSNEELDARLAMIATSFNQNAGTAAMGSVVDTKCGVKGVRKLRVCDASILTTPIAAHNQAPMYGFGGTISAILLNEA